MGIFSRWFGRKKITEEKIREVQDTQKDFEIRETEKILEDLEVSEALENSEIPETEEILETSEPSEVEEVSEVPDIIEEIPEIRKGMKIQEKVLFRKQSVRVKDSNRL